MTAVQLVLQFVIPFLLERLKDSAPAIVAAAITAVTPVILEMINQADEENLARLSFRFRAPYEARLLDILRAIKGLGDLVDDDA